MCTPARPGWDASDANFDRIHSSSNFVKGFFEDFLDFFAQANYGKPNAPSSAAHILLLHYTYVLCLWAQRHGGKTSIDTSTPRPSIETGGSLLVGLYQCCLPAFLELGAFVLC